MNLFSGRPDSLQTIQEFWKLFFFFFFLQCSRSKKKINYWMQTAVVSSSSSSVQDHRLWRTQDTENSPSALCSRLTIRPPHSLEWIIYPNALSYTTDTVCNLYLWTFFFLHCFLSLIYKYPHLCKNHPPYPHSHMIRIITRTADLMGCSKLRCPSAWNEMCYINTEPSPCPTASLKRDPSTKWLTL